jgi:hypothetical protein
MRRMTTKRERLGPGGWLIFAVLLALLAAAILYAVRIWTSVDTAMSGWGWLFMILGIIVTTALGAGLMALVFYSSRHGMDR